MQWNHWWCCQIQIQVTFRDQTNGNIMDVLDDVLQCPLLQQASHQEALFVRKFPFSVLSLFNCVQSAWNKDFIDPKIVFFLCNFFWNKLKPRGSLILAQVKLDFICAAALVKQMLSHDTSHEESGRPSAWPVGLRELGWHFHHTGGYPEEA